MLQLPDPDIYASWRIPLPQIDEIPWDLPSEWAAALQAVTRDLPFLGDGQPLDIDDQIWALDASGDCGMMIGMHSASGDTGFQVGRGYSVDASAAQATVWTAGEVQDFLAGYRFRLWPFINRVMLAPQLHDDEAVWMNSSISKSIPIGRLDQMPLVRRGH